MDVNQKDILLWLSKLEFNIQSGKKECYSKIVYGYELSVDLKTSKINYGKDIIIHRTTTSNLSQDENLVVLECVCRLLEKGYSPKDIELEKSWNLGHKGKGFLDVLVKDKQSNSLFMIECKTWGAEFNKEKNKMFKDGGQLLSYFRQDKKPKALCLYASSIKGDKIHYTNEIIDTEGLSGENETEIFDSWSKSFLPKGIFEKHVSPYEFKTIGLSYDDLEDLEKSDGKTIFNQFAEILRRHVVSDKTNAFNKIFNLFICKIKDEDQRYNKSNEELLFQYKRGENYEQLIDKLKELYKVGLKDYINIIVPYINKEDLQRGGALTEEQINEILYYRESQEFSFKDVYNKETFEDNAEIVKEVVELLQKYKIKYAGKQQHLGDFFELLLNTGIKQESGQFFTPIPIARFICKSLPIEQIIERKNNNKELYFLPYVMDYASGSGHFITEMMDEIDGYVKSFDENDIKGGRKAQEEFRKNKDYIAWAKEYIYAIEKDYRLVKISKIASFLNGDGDANVMSGDGLAPFVSDKYTGILKTSEDKKENTNFDVIVANPPYSVSGFKKNFLKEYDKLKLNPEKYFELYNNLTDQSSEIECLFIERTKQLLKEGGVAGVILPISILTNGGIYEKTREIIFKNFTFKAIVSLGSNAFMATGTKTIIAFLQKRNHNDYKNIEKEVDKFLEGGFVDVAVGGIKDAFSTYVRNVYEMDFETYKQILAGQSTSHELSKEYKDLDQKQIKELEKQKLIYFILTYPQKIVLGDSGEKDIEKEFYGFEFSNRRGHEGIHIYKDEEGYLQSKLYNENDLTDAEKLNTYILKSFTSDAKLENEIADIQTSDPTGDGSQTHPLKDHIHYLRLSNLMTFDLKRFDKSVNLNKRNNLKIDSKWGLVELSEISTVDWGNTSITKDAYKQDGQYPAFSAAGQDGMSDVYEHDCSGIVLSAIGARCGKCFKAENKWLAIKNTIILKDFKDCLRDYIFEIVNNETFWKKSGAGQPFIGVQDARAHKLPLPPLEIQQKIVAEIGEVEKREIKARERLEIIDNKLKSLCNISSNKEKLQNIATMIKRGKSPKYGFSDIQIIKSGQVRGMCNFDFTKKYFASKDFILDDRRLENGDILINSTGVGTAGRVNLFELAGNFVVDTHVTIVRLDKDKVLPKFVLYQLWNIGFANIEKMANGQSGQIELSKEAIENITIVLPTLPEQQKIIAQIEPLEKEIEESKSFLATVKEQKQTILDKYLK
jgi:type I restriction enzyme M protein